MVEAIVPAQLQSLENPFDCDADFNIEGISMIHENSKLSKLAHIIIKLCSNHCASQGTARIITRT
jgi:hypothetical protein